MTDLISDKSDGDVLYASDINNMLAERDGHFLPISNSTKNYVDATQNLGSGTYRFLNGYFSTSVITPKIQAESSAGLSLFDDGGNGIFVEDGGKIGIMTVDPAEPLHVICGQTTGLLLQYNANDEYDAVFSYRKGRGTTGTPAQVVDNDLIGRTVYNAYINGSYRACALFGAEIEGTPGASSYPSAIFFSTIEDSSTTLTERMRIKNSGYVGINTVAPGKRLEINDATGQCLRLTYNDSDGSATNYSDLLISSAGHLILSPSGANVGINTTAPDKALEINHATGACLRLTYNDSNGSASLYADLSVENDGSINIASTGYFKVADDAIFSGDINAYGGQIFARDSNDLDGRYAGIGSVQQSGTHYTGYLTMVSESGTVYYIWVDNNGKLEISTTFSHIGGTSGTIIGTQS